MFARLGHKILIVVALAVGFGMLAIVLFYNHHQERTILKQNERTMGKLVESVHQSLQTIMVAGYADIAQTFADNLKKVPEIIDFRILRRNGLEAFRDNQTIRSVNRRLGEELFLAREQIDRQRVLSANAKPLHQAIESERTVSYYEQHGRQRQLTFIAPIPNSDKCHRCHGESPRIRGLLKITTSMGPVEADIQDTRLKSAGLLLFSIAAILLLTTVMLRRTVLRPIQTVIRAMTRASEGDLTQQVPVMGSDEISRMAESFNTMTRQLLITYKDLQGEQDKLTTIIQSAREGIVVTDGQYQIVLTNPATRTLLNKSQEQLVREGFSAILDSPDQMEAWLSTVRTQRQQLQETIRYHHRTLSVTISSIWDDAGEHVGSAALLRDITEERALEEQLRHLSNTDALTGLYNRRYLDERLETELERAQRYGLSLSFMMIDIDHFKHFNDEFGHETGDQVLQTLAKVMQELVRTSDIPCRYGGEEFVIILTNTNQAGAQDLAERLRQRVEATPMAGEHVTISIGVASHSASHPHNSAELLQRADAALYRSKAEGRNRVTLATD